MKFEAVYYEPSSLSYDLGKELKAQFDDIPWYPIESHNAIQKMREKPNSKIRPYEAQPGRRHQEDS